MCNGNYSLGCVTSSRSVAHARRVAYVNITSGTTRLLVLIEEGMKRNGRDISYCFPAVLQSLRVACSSSEDGTKNPAGLAP